MDNPLEVQHLADMWRPLTAVEEGRARALVDYAWALLTDSAPGIADRVADEKVSVTTVRLVLLEACLRVLKNPDGTRQESKQVDDYLETITLDRAVSSGRLYFSPDELARVSGQRSSAQAFVINQMPR